MPHSLLLSETAFDVYSTDPGQQRRVATYPEAPLLLGPNGLQSGGGIYGSARPFARELSPNGRALSPQLRPPQQPGGGLYGSARPLGRELSPQGMRPQQSFGQVQRVQVQQPQAAQFAPMSQAAQIQQGGLLAMIPANGQYQARGPQPVQVQTMQPVRQAQAIQLVEAQPMGQQMVREWSPPQSRPTTLYAQHPAQEMRQPTPPQSRRTTLEQAEGAQRADASPPPPPPVEYQEPIIQTKIQIVEREVVVEKLVEVEVDRIVDRIVEVPRDKLVYSEIAIPVDKIVIKEVEVEVEVQRVVRDEIPVEVARVVVSEVARPVVVERVVEVHVPVYVDRVVVKEVPVVVELVVVYKEEVPVYIERLVEKVTIHEVQVPFEIKVPHVIEKIIEKEVPVTIHVKDPNAVDKEVYEQLQARADALAHEVERLHQQLDAKNAEGPVIQFRDKIVEVEKLVEVPVEKIVIKYVDVEVEKIVYRDREPAKQEAEVDRGVDRDREPAKQISPPVPTFSTSAISVSLPPRPAAKAAMVYTERPAEKAAPPRMVGLGLALERVLNDPTTYVQEIIPGFAAHRSGQFAIHDILLAVDQEPVEGWDLDSIKQLTVGGEGTRCTLQVVRGERYFSVILERCAPPAPTSTAYDSTMYGSGRNVSMQPDPSSSMDEPSAEHRTSRGSQGGTSFSF